ncbi:hypothetical protein CDAR_271591 [Caerostris darwini]|uniref:Uncharacterized protein n=1 Tax=Caerostris darwini TaxID=1538125 RepID=A0AAV4T0Y1_9ARAC|nr:hypothetical protein CDAR_271591 [Caerostris darwini]
MLKQLRYGNHRLKRAFDKTPHYLSSTLLSLILGGGVRAVRIRTVLPPQIAQLVKQHRSETSIGIFKSTASHSVVGSLRLFLVDTVL